MFATLVSLKTPLGLIAAGLLLLAASVHVVGHRPARAASPRPPVSATTPDTTDAAAPSNDIEDFQQLG